MVDWIDGGSEGEEAEAEAVGAGVWIVTMKVPPVEGWRATSPRAMENVERSSWAYFFFFLWMLV